MLFRSERSLIQPNRAWIDGILIWGSAMMGGLLVLIFHRRLIYLGVAGVGAIIILSGACFFLLQSGVWVAFVPAAIAIVATGLMTISIDRSIQHEV